MAPLLRLIKKEELNQKKKEEERMNDLVPAPGIFYRFVTFMFVYITRYFA